MTDRLVRLLMISLFMLTVMTVAVTLAKPIYCMDACNGCQWECEPHAVPLFREDVQCTCFGVVTTCIDCCINPC